MLHDRQLTKCPAHLIAFAEATEDCEVLLGDPSRCEPDFGADPQSRVQTRLVREHWVVRGRGSDAALLLAVRKDVAAGD